MMDYKSIDQFRMARWLRQNGWKVQREYMDGVFYIKTHPQMPDVEDEILLPKDKKYTGFARRMNEALDTLSALTGKDAAELVQEIMCVGEDIVRIHATGSRIGLGTISIDGGLGLFTNARNMLEAAACSVCEPRSAYKARRPQAAVEFMKGVRMAAPERGSFVVSLAVPIAPADDPEELPFARRVTSMLASGLQLAKEAAARAGMTGETSAFEAGVTRGISANLCAAVSQIFDAPDIDAADVFFGWTPDVDASPRDVCGMSFSREEAAVLRDGACTLRQNTVENDVVLCGCVVQLKRDAVEGPGDIVLFTQIDGKQRRVSVRLDRAEDYQKAIEAHQSGSLLQVCGLLSPASSLSGRLAMKDVQEVSMPSEKAES